MLQRSCLALLVSFVSLMPAAHAVEWQQPTPDELTMTADPAAPNADAVYLYREETADDKLHMRSVYVRMKILRDEGKQYGDVEIDFGNAFNSITDIQGRTIHSDGTVIPFTGKPYEKLLIRAGNLHYKAKVFSLPDVQAGSILEFRYKLRYDDNSVISPFWTIQQPLYVHKAHYHFVPTERVVISSIDGDSATSSLAYGQLLPPGAKMQVIHGAYELDVANIPGIPYEQYAPPLGSLAYHVRFYYTSVRSAEEFWRSYGKRWSHTVDGFAAPSPAISHAAQELTQGASTEDQKLQRLYMAVMKLENTSFTRARSQDENRAEGVKRIKSATDILNLKRGSADDLAMLFLSLARAAGMHAYAMEVVNRNQGFYDPNFLSGEQFDNLIVIAMVDGKERMFDPGERYAGYGQLSWRHSQVRGLRQTEGGKTAIAATTGNEYQQNTVQRNATLKLAADGTLSGSASIVLTGAEALRWRQKALEGDMEALKKEFDEELQTGLPPGVILHVHHFLGLDTPESNLMARMEVSGNLGTSTGKRVFLPLSVFSSGSHPFSSSHRDEPIDLRFPYLEKDDVTLMLPEGLHPESTPAAAKASLTGMAAYAATTKSTDTSITYSRSLIMANVLYEAKEYSKLKGFLDEVSTKDHEQAVLQLTAARVGQ